MSSLYATPLGQRPPPHCAIRKHTCRNVIAFHMPHPHAATQIVLPANQIPKATSKITNYVCVVRLLSVCVCVCVWHHNVGHLSVCVSFQFVYVCVCIQFRGCAGNFFHFNFRNFPLDLFKSFQLHFDFENNLRNLKTFCSTQVVQVDNEWQLDQQIPRIENNLNKRNFKNSQKKRQSCS